MQGNSHEHKIAMNSTVDLHYKESISMFAMLNIFITVMRLCED